MIPTLAGCLMPHIGSAPVVDPFFDFVTLLLHPEANGSIVDRSKYGAAISNTNVTVHAGGSPSNPMSMVNTVALGTVLQAASGPQFARTSAEPWTLEFSLRVNTLPAPGQSFYLLAWDSSHYSSIGKDIGFSTFNVQTVDPGGAGYGVSLNPGQWYQFALTNDGTNNHAFRDGVLIASGAGVSDVLSSPRPYGVFNIPSRADLNSPLVDLAEVRLTMGVCRYTASYTPATQPFPNA